jgi:hypothetical protein
MDMVLALPPKRAKVEPSAVAVKRRQVRLAGGAEDAADS